MSDTEREYTPTIEAVRGAYADVDGPDRYDSLLAAFDRMLAAHDAQVRADERERIQGEIAQAIRDHSEEMKTYALPSLDLATGVFHACALWWRDSEFIAERIARSGGAS